jgi:alpha-glucosidase
VTSPEPDAQTADAPWWQRGVAYQIYPRSFADHNGDGVGDLPGITAHLDHVRDLGVDAVWLSPFFTSPMADFGYDVADFCDVDPVFGTLDDFDRLLAEAHQRDLKVIIDWVPNHTSDQHPWFQESRRGLTDPKRDWYVWRDPATDGGPPNNWRASFADDEPAWTFDEKSGQYYLHLFLPEQPDLNWGNPEVVDAMHATLRFWLDRGVDGFRADVIHAIGKDPALPDNAADIAAIPHSALNHDPRTHALLRDIRTLVDSYPGDRMMVGEVFLLSTELVATYYGDGDELHLAFNFPPLFAPWDRDTWVKRINRVVEELDPRGAWPSWVLSNHDVVRHRSRYGTDGRARAAAVLLCTLRGTPFLYQGEELGLQDAEVPPDRVVDPGGRDGCRAPIPWTSEARYGWSGAEPWLPFPPDAATRNVHAEDSDPGSFLNLYRRILRARRASAALSTGQQELLPAPEGVLAYRRSSGGDRRTVLINFTDRAIDGIELAGSPAEVEVASNGEGEGQGFAGRLGPDQAVILR